MTRILLHRRYWERKQDYDRRKTIGVQSYWTPSGVQGLAFIDYWSQYPATIPEKMVFAELQRRGVNFYFSYYWGDFPFTPDEEERYRPDFILPDYQLIIEVFGFYWHTRSGMNEHDAERTALLIAAGWTVAQVYDFDVLANVQNAIDVACPMLVSPSIQRGGFQLADRPFDPNAALAARTRKYPRVWGVHYRDTRPGPQGVDTSWKTMTYIRKAARGPYPIFSVSQFDAAYLMELEQYGVDWREWLHSVHHFFYNINNGTGMDAEGYSRTYTQAALWAEYNKWRDWWQRYRPGEPLFLP